MPSKIVFLRIIIDSRRVLDGRDFLPQFTHKGKTRLVQKKVKEAKKFVFQRNDVPVMRDISTSETIQLSFFLEFLKNRTRIESDRSSYAG